MPNRCGLCGGSGATTSVAGLVLCEACASVDPTEALTARGQPAVFREAMLRFTAGVHVPGVPEGFVLRCAPERWTHAVAKLVVDEVEVGDPVFDDGVFVRTNDATTARRFLAPEGVQSALLALLAGARPEIVPNHVTLEGPTLTVSVRPLATLDAEEWLVRQLATAALAVHWRQDGAQDKLQVYPRAMTYEDQLIAIEDVADVDLAQALAAAIALPAEGHEQAAQRSLMLGSFTARDGDLEAALTHLEAAAASARGAGLPVLEAEAQVTRASVHAALGDYDAALPMLRAEVERLQGIAGTEDLLRDARAELEAYETLLGV